MAPELLDDVFVCRVQLQIVFRERRRCKSILLLITTNEARSHVIEDGVGIWSVEVAILGRKDVSLSLSDFVVCNSSNDIQRTLVELRVDVQFADELCHRIDGRREHLRVVKLIDRSDLEQHFLNYVIVRKCVDKQGDCIVASNAVRLTFKLRDISLYEGRCRWLEYLVDDHIVARVS